MEKEVKTNTHTSPLFIFFKFHTLYFGVCLFVLLQYIYLISYFQFTLQIKILIFAHFV